MTKPLEDLKTKFSDFLRPNIYVIYITPNKPFYQQDTNLIGILCHEATFPFYTFTTNSFFYNNVEAHVLNKIDYDPATFTFYVDKDNVILGFFDAWFKQMINEDHQYGYYDDYISTVQIEMYDRRFQLAAKATLIDAFPINLESMNLAYNQNDTITNLQVSFQFKQIEYTFKKTNKQPQWHRWRTKVPIPPAATHAFNMTQKFKNIEAIKNIKLYDVVAKAKRLFS
jgi:hypothetical protein